MSGKQNKKLRKLVSDNTKDGLPSKQNMRKLKKSYNNLSSATKGFFINTLQKINQKNLKKGVDGSESKA